MNEKFSKFIHQYHNTPIAVAVSGGVDSICLLYWLARSNLKPTVLHVNHCLRDAANTEAKYVQETCKKLNLPCKIFYWSEDKPASGLEAAARDARYKMMTDWCHENNILTLMVAHQADDQIETFLMNLARGSGVTGLSAMQRTSYRDGIQIVRPLLGIFRSELIKYCEQNDIKYFSDEMNYDDKYTRVKIRQNRHLLSKFLGISDNRILLAIENLGRTREALELNQTKKISQVLHNNYALFPDSFLFDEPTDISLKLLGTLIKIIGGDNYQPRLNSLNFALIKLKSDCQFTLGHCTIRRFKDQILIVPEGTKTSIRKKNEKLERLKKNNKQNKIHQKK